MDLEEVIARLAALVAALQPSQMDGATAAGLTATFDRGERLCAAGRALVAARAGACGAWTAGGARNEEEGLAGLCGTSRADARAILAAGEAAAKMDKLDGALRSGELSPRQAAEIAEAVADDPGVTDRLLDAARQGGLPAVRGEARKARNDARTAEDDRARAERLRRQRCLRFWTDRDGAGHLQGRLAPDSYARFLAVFEPFERQALDEARAAGRREGFDAYRADALLLMAARAAATGPASTPGRHIDSDSGGLFARTATSHPELVQPLAAPDPLRRYVPAEMIVVVDRQALIRGHTSDGEDCYVQGVGPVPVAIAQQILDDAFLCALLKDGVDIRKVVHLGRHPNRMQKTALRVRDPRCVVPGCGSVHGLEADHCPEFERTGHTTLDELAHLCQFHHDQKTYCGALLSGTPGAWQWTPPPPGPFDDPLPGPFDDP